MANISNALNKCYDGMKDCVYYTASKAGATLSSIGSCIVTTISSAGSYIATLAKKIAAFVKPYLQQLLTFAKQNKESLIIGGLACGVGSILTVLFSRMCSAKVNVRV